MLPTGKPVGQNVPRCPGEQSLPSLRGKRGPHGEGGLLEFLLIKLGSRMKKKKKFTGIFLLMLEDK